MNAEPLFWCVWAEDGASPTVKQTSFAKAKREAQRLARENSGRRFIVMAAAVAFQKQDLVETRFQQGSDDGIPF